MRSFGGTTGPYRQRQLPRPEKRLDNKSKVAFLGASGRISDGVRHVFVGAMVRPEKHIEKRREVCEIMLCVRDLRMMPMVKFGRAWLRFRGHHASARDELRHRRG